jgi:hypothetical protein
VPRETAARLLLVALEPGDDIALAALLHPAVRLVVDSGDRSGGEARGRSRVTAALRERLTGHPDASLEAVDVNGDPGLALRRVDSRVDAVLAIGVGAGGRITELWLSTAPTKLTHWNRHG